MCVVIWFNTDQMSSLCRGWGSSVCPLLGGSRKGEQLYLTEKNETYEAFNNFYYRKSLKVSFSDFQLNGYPFTPSSVVKGLEYSPNAKKCH